jgi:hypothetical protein
MTRVAADRSSATACRAARAASPSNGARLTVAFVVDPGGVLWHVVQKPN